MRKLLLLAVFGLVSASALAAGEDAVTPEEAMPPVDFSKAPTQSAPVGAMKGRMALCKNIGDFFNKYVIAKYNTVFLPKWNAKHPDKQRKPIVLSESNQSILDASLKTICATTVAAKVMPIEAGKTAQTSKVDLLAFCTGGFWDNLASIPLLAPVINFLKGFGVTQNLTVMNGCVEYFTAANLISSDDHDKFAEWVMMQSGE